MKKWLLLAPAAAAVGAAVFVALRKRPETPAAPKAGKPAEKAKAPAGNLKTGSYSFISGFRDAATVELTLRYDADRFTFAVVEDEFLTDTSASHAAILYGEDFDVQIEYAGYYAGENFAAFSTAVAERYQGFGKVSYQGVEGIRYYDGDNLCLCFPAGDDAYSYLLVTVARAKDNDDPIDALVEDPNLSALLGSMQVAIRR